MVRKTALFLVAACLPAFGDFSYEQTSKITGGMMAGMMKFAGFMQKIGMIKTVPGSWRAYAFDHLHELPGS